MFKDNQEKPYIIIFLAMLIINDFRLLIIKQTIKQTTIRLFFLPLIQELEWIYILGVGIASNAFFSYAIILLFKSKSRIIISSLLLDTVASFFIVWM